MGVEVAKDEVHDDHDEHHTATKSTREDAENMRRMGRSQQLVRHFRLLSVASFVAIATAAWKSIFLKSLLHSLMEAGCLWSTLSFGTSSALILST
jgi:hypothetical protein